MGRNKRIPVVKNRIDAKRKKKSSKAAQLWIIVLVLVFMLLHVWLKVQTNLQRTQIQELEKRLAREKVETEKLQAEVEQLSNFGRIYRIAQEELGLVFIPNEDIIEIPQE